MTVATPEVLAERVTRAFERIHREHMAGLPLLNNSIDIETVGFRVYQGRMLGMLITPWMMNLVLFPRADDEWPKMALGDKQTHPFPGGTVRFMVNAVDGLGTFQMHSVHSPMRAFSAHAEALAEATAFLERLFTPVTELPDEDQLEEELLGRVLRGESLPGVDAALSKMQPEPADIARG
jgi:[NiFe] hydrogenase assembly HybE family chaperone